MQRSRLLLIESSSLKKCQQSEAYQTSYGKEINPYGNQVLYCLVQIIALFVNLRGIEPLDSAILSFRHSKPFRDLKNILKGFLGQS
jgi:hypothetical protein